MSKKKELLLAAAALVVAVVLIFWRYVFPKREEGDETTMLDDMSNTASIKNPFADARTKAVALVKKWEGLYLKAYLDSASIPTIGYGTIKYPDGKKVKIGDVCTREQAESWLAYELDPLLSDIAAKARVSLTSGMHASLASLAYNIGLSSLYGSTLWRLLQAGEDKDVVAAEFLKWNKATVSGVKTVIAGLTNRRNDEKQVFTA